MSERVNLPAGLYFVGMNVHHAYLLNPGDRPPLPNQELRMLDGFLQSAYVKLDRVTKSGPSPDSRPSLPEGAPNGLGRGMGLYYVSDGGTVYHLLAKDGPDAPQLEMAGVLPLIKDMRDRLYA